MEKLCVGIDIAKLTFVSAIKTSNGYQVKSFDNNIEGFKKFTQWLQDFKQSSYHCCMEATSQYGYKLALFLYQHQYVVSMVNPAKIKYFIKSQLVRNKTDKADAKLIAQYCELLNPVHWQPLPSEIEVLQALVKRLDVLNNILLEEENRLEQTDSVTAESLHAHIIYLNTEIKAIQTKINSHIEIHPSLKKDADLLRSIPGIGKKTTQKIIAFLTPIVQFSKAKQLAAFVGLNPQHAQSGTSLNYSHLSKVGKSQLRKMLYMPALVAIKHNQTLKLFYEKLLSKGKPKKLAICAVMRKLVHIIYGVLKSQKSFNIDNP